MKTENQELIRDAVRTRYRQVATADATPLENDSQSRGCCAPSAASSTHTKGGCGCGAGPTADQWGAMLGYSDKELSSTPEGANMGLGCGNPVALATLRPGENVVDLGSGGGFDCFLAAQRVGPDGQVIGIDMTPEMVSKARRNAEKAAAANVEFRLGEIEHLPVADNSADVIISNCVINLSVDKSHVYQDAFRVLKPGGRLAISDIMATAPLSPAVRHDLSLVSSCVGGAATPDETRTMLEKAGFINIRIEPRGEGCTAVSEFLPEGSESLDQLVSATIAAHKPEQPLTRTTSKKEQTS